MRLPWKKTTKSDLRQRVAETCAPAEPRVELNSLSIKGLDGQTFQLQADDDATVEHVYKYVSEKICHKCRMRKSVSSSNECISVRLSKVFREP